MNFHAVCHTCKHQHTISVEEAGYGWLAWRAKHAGHKIDLLLSQEAWQNYEHNADAYPSYLASSNLTVTNLNSLTSSSTHITGWEGGAIDNSGSAPRAGDFRITAKITVASAGLSAGEIRLYLVGMLDDSTWPDVFDGTESVETVTDIEIRNAICRPAAQTDTDTTASRVYYLECASVAAVFGGNMPHKFVPFITQSTGAALAASGNQVTVKGSYFTIA